MVCFCSPHVSSIRERIAINAQPVSQAAFDALGEQHGFVVKSVQSEVNATLTHFEVLTALAMQHFQDTQVSSSRHAVMRLSLCN